MSKKNLIEKIKILIEERKRTIKANKIQMRDNLKEYKKNLELDRKLKAECRTLSEAVYDLMKKDNMSVPVNIEETELKNNASNRDIDIFTSDEE
jgi:uncharacterized protein (DUF488 family)